jgi:hypothetical protein
MHQTTITASHVLRDPLFTVAPDGPDRPLTLPALIARLLAGPEDVLSFPHVTPIQRSYWYRFLVRCAAKALHAMGLDVQRASTMAAAELSEGIEAALVEAAGSDEAWRLFQPDPLLPGFLQPPTPDGQAPENGYAEESTSLLTTAIGSKNHERKVDVDRSLTTEQTVYALVEYQSGVIFGGRGNYGSQLMGSASGAGSGTPFMGVRIGSGYVETFRHDVGVFLDRWEYIRDRLEVRGSVWALWTLRWDGENPLPAKQLDPAFIPLARLIRVDAPDENGRFRRVWFKPTNAARVLDHTDGGVLGDIFTPLVPNPKHPGGFKVRGTMRWGYGYEEVVNLLFRVKGAPSDTVTALVGSPAASRTDVRVVFEGTAFEQGKTGGFHQREVLFPSTSALAFLAQPEPVQQAHAEMLHLAKAAKSAIRGATRVLLAGTPKPREGDDAKVEGPARELEREIDRIYIPTLLAAAERRARGDMDYLTEWGKRLSDLTRSTFQRTMRGIPTSGARRYEREVLAATWLDYRLRVMRGEVTGGQAIDDGGETFNEEDIA